MRRALGILACAALSLPSAAIADSLTASVSRPDIPYKGTVSVSGTAPAGTAVTLQANPYPYRGYSAVTQGVAAADGSFTFAGLTPDRNTRYRVVAGDAASGELQVTVEAPSVNHVYTLRYGMVMATVLSYHPASFNWGGRTAWWFVAAGGSRHYHLVATTHTHERAPGVTYMTATFLPPRGRFVYRVCFEAPGEQAFGPPRKRYICPHSDFVDVRAA